MNPHFSTAHMGHTSMWWCAVHGLS